MADLKELRDLFQYPGADPRQWISIGTVDISTPQTPSIRFKDENGKPLASGPLVHVTLQPSGIPVACRVSNTCAGNGEGEWYPFVDKDEVVVVLPQGDEGDTPVIIGRLNQAIDVFPLTVAGQDASANNFGFKRMRAPFVVEAAGAYLIRSALTGSQIGIDQQGQVIINDANKSRLFFSPDVIELSSGDGTTFLQIQVSAQRVALGAGAATFSLAADTNLMVPGVLNVGTSGAGGSGHAITAEQVVAMFLNYTAALQAASAFNPLSPFASTWVAASAPIMNAIVTALAAGSQATPVGPLPGGNLAAVQPALAAFLQAMASPTPQQDATGLTPGIGRAGFLL